MITRPSDEDIAAVLEFLPYFEDAQNRFYEVSEELALDPYDYSAEVQRFKMTLYKRNLIQDFDWPSWQEYGIRYVESPDLIATAPMSDLLKLLTVHVRKDRYVGGHMAWAIKSGQILAILRRLKVLSSKDERPKTKD